MYKEEDIMRVKENSASTKENGASSILTDQNVKFPKVIEEYDHGSCINDAFMLGWEIVELQSRIRIGLTRINENSLQVASIWRAIFNRIAVLQVKAFPLSSTAETLYEPPSKESLPYLYHPNPDYANVGISDLPTLAKFKLYDVTRRAINCLTLLYVKEEDSLVPKIVNENQLTLVKKILEAAKNPEAGGGEIPPDSADQIENQVVSTLPNTFLQDNIVAARQILTERTLKFLTAWEGFLRENYYVSGQIPNDDTELIAFEAGRSMSWVSWGISVKTVMLDETVQQLDPKDAKEKYLAAWQEIFDTKAIIQLQHQITALSSTLDESYYKSQKRKNTNQTDDSGSLDDVNLPSNTIRAVKNSIDYWHRTVDWISKTENWEKARTDLSDIAACNRAMKLALMQQADIWQTLMTGQQSLNAFNLECVTHKIMDDVTTKIQQALQANFKQGLEQAKGGIKEITDEVKDAVVFTGQTALTGLNAVFQSSKSLIWLIVGISIFMLVLISVLYLTSTHNSSIGVSGGIGSVISVVLGYFGLNSIKTTKESHASTVQERQNATTSKINQRAQTAPANSSGNLLSKVQGATVDAANMIWTAFERGYGQIRKELASVNRSAAVSYPLIEFFTLTFTLTADEEFLTQIIWSSKERSDEVKRIIAAALGPLAILISLPPSDDAN